VRRHHRSYGGVPDRRAARYEDADRGADPRAVALVGYRRLDGRGASMSRCSTASRSTTCAAGAVLPTPAPPRCRTLLRTTTAGVSG
jgi:hypothetical protein